MQIVYLAKRSWSNNTKLLSISIECGTLIEHKKKQTEIEINPDNAKP